MTSSRFAYCALCLSLASCAELGERELGLCGNGIVEPNFDETCDGEADCIDPGEPSECQFSCADSPRACPEGAACGLDGVCRAPADAFELSTLGGDRPVPWVEATDLDGDGKAELLWVEADQPVTPDNRDVALHVTRFDSAREPDSWSLDEEASIPSLDDIDDDGRTDLVLGLRDTTNPGAVALRHQQDGTFSPIHVMTDVKPRAGVHAVTSTGTGSYLLHTADQLWYSDGAGADKLLVEGAPALAWTDSVALGDWFVDEDESAWSFAYVGGAAQDADRYDGPVTIVCEGEDGPRDTSAVRLPDGFDILLPWVAFADVDGLGAPDLLVAVENTGDVQNPEVELGRSLIMVAYGANETWGEYAEDDCPSFHSSSTPTDPEQPDLRFAAEPLFDVDEAFDDRAGAARGMRVVDLDQDGTLEVVSAAGVTNRDISFPQSSGAPEIADIDGDGWLDVLIPTADRGTGAIVVLRSELGGFVEDSLALEGPPRAVLAGDFDADGNADIAVQVSEPLSGPWPSALLIRWGAREDDGFVPVLRGSQMIGMAANGQAPGDSGPSAAELLVAMRLSPAEVSNPEVGMARLRSLGGSILASPASAPEGWWPHAWTLATRPDNPVRLRLALGGRPGSAGRPDIWAAEFGLEASGFLREYSSGIVGPNQFLEAPGWTDHVNAIETDLDGDGEEVLVTFEAADPDGPQFGETTIRELRLEGGRPVFESRGSTSLHFGPSASALAPGKAVPEANGIVELDADTDGDLDLFAIVEDDEGRGGRVPALGINEEGFVGRWEPLGMEIPGLASWSFVTEDLSRALITTDGRVAAGRVDVEAGTFDIRWQAPLASVTLWSAVGDLDGDGLPDVALGTDAGLTIYWGTPAYGGGA